MSVTPFVSVIVPCRNEAGFIRACLESLLHTDYPSDAFEVLVVDGMSDDGTRADVGALQDLDARVVLLDNPQRITPTALNIGIRRARGEVVVRIDAHNHYPRNYISALVRWLGQSGADNVGGLCRTVPANSSGEARAIARALSHPFAVGNAQFRIGTREPRWVDTVPFGCYRRDVFERIGLFDEELIRNQDDEFNHRLLKAGGRILLVPDVTSDYFARESFGKLARMLYQYGYFKPLAARKLGRLFTVRQVVPAAFVVGLTASLLLLVLGDGFLRVVALAPISLYLLFALGAALRAAREESIPVAAMLVGCFVIIHMSYGVGFLRGVWHFILTTRPAPAQETIALTR